MASDDGRKRQLNNIEKSKTLADLAKVARTCRACELYKNATQSVFGEGPSGAAIMLVGEQPADKEDKSGHPFVGGAGRLLNQALAEAGIEREDVYVTNAVKHFKWAPSDRSKKIRIHKKPTVNEVKACYPWLQAEIEKVKPKVIVALGATAALAVFGRTVVIGNERGHKMKTQYGIMALVTWHPASILRAIDGSSKTSKLAELILDLKLARQMA